MPRSVNCGVILIFFVGVDLVLIKLAREALLVQYPLEAPPSLLDRVEKDQQAQVVNGLDFQGIKLVCHLVSRVNQASKLLSKIKKGVRIGDLIGLVLSDSD